MNLFYLEVTFVSNQIWQRPRVHDAGPLRTAWDSGPCQTELCGLGGMDMTTHKHRRTTHSHLRSEDEHQVTQRESSPRIINHRLRDRGLDRKSRSRYVQPLEVFLEVPLPRVGEPHPYHVVDTDTNVHAQ